MFNFRNYDGIDESFVEILQKNKAELGASVDFIPGNDDIYTAFARDVSTSYVGDIILTLNHKKLLIYNGQ